MNYINSHTYKIINKNFKLYKTNNKNKINDVKIVNYKK